jgi:hypothetical protein
MGVIIGLRPACRASLLHRHTPIKPRFGYWSDEPLPLDDFVKP